MVDDERMLDGASDTRRDRQASGWKGETSQRIPRGAQPHCTTLDWINRHAKLTLVGTNLTALGEVNRSGLARGERGKGFGGRRRLNRTALGLGCVTCPGLIDRSIHVRRYLSIFTTHSSNTDLLKNR